jgi:hypothetical protein
MSAPTEGPGTSADRFRQLPDDVPLVDTVAHLGEEDVHPEPIPLGPDGMDVDGD